jgi:small subunit ribosomal protein S15
MRVGGLQELSMPITKEEKSIIVNEFGKGSQDTGSSQVQVALLTKNINKLTMHCQKNPKDFSTRRGLLQMVCDRRSFLKYLQKTDADKYKELVAKLGLRK